MCDFRKKLNDHEREMYDRFHNTIKSDNTKEAETVKSGLVSPLNNLISFNPFQYEPYHKLIQQEEYPKVVYIADEVGAGKTIETGIILTELLFQREISINSDICLIICPNLLCRKWRQTLKTLFGLDASIIYSLKDIHNGISIVSFDTISRTESNIISSLSHLGLLVIDEAHNASGVRFEKIKILREKVNSKKGYVVLLSATPLNGSDNDEEKQVELLFSDKRIREGENNENSGNFFSKESRYLSKNTKEVMRYAVNPERYTVNVEIRNHFVENDALIKFTECCQSLFSGKNTLLQFQGLNQIMSSPKAGLLYLDNILKKDDDTLLEYLISSHEKADNDDESEDDEFEDEEYYKEYSMDDVKFIRTNLESIKGTMYHCLEKDEDAKFNELLKLIEDNKSKFKDGNNPENTEWSFYNHIAVFTDRVSTAYYLEEKLKEHYEQEEVSVFRVTGEMFESEKRARIMQYENETKKMSILIITNVACEGQDMDYGNTIVNYDLDYNPVRLEQRRGRIDRFEVKKDNIFIHNFMVKDFDYNPAQPEKVCNSYSKVKKIMDKIDVICKSTGTYYEILKKDDKKSIPVDEDTLNKKKDDVFSHLVKIVMGECASKGVAIKGSRELRDFMLPECLKQFGDYVSVDNLISDRIRHLGNTKIAFSESTNDVTVSTKIDNQELLHYIFNGGTMISHLVLEDR